MRLGKKPASYDHRDLLMHEFIDHGIELKQAPVRFGHYHDVKTWGMLGNDYYGDCVWAGAAHEHMMIDKMNDVIAHFDSEVVLGDYSAVTGFNPHDPSSDQGTDMRVAMNYRRKTGIKDVAGNRHKIVGYVALEPGNWEQHLEALYIFDCIAVGIEFPTSAMDQFNAGKPWTYVPSSPIEGGHYIPVVGRPYLNYLALITWGAYKRMSKQFFQAYNDESFAFITSESLSKLTAKTPEGFDITALETAIKGI